GGGAAGRRKRRGRAGIGTRETKTREAGTSEKARRGDAVFPPRDDPTQARSASAGAADQLREALARRRGPGVAAEASAPKTTTAAPAGPSRPVDSASSTGEVARGGGVASCSSAPPPEATGGSAPPGSGSSVIEHPHRSKPCFQSSGAALSSSHRRKISSLSATGPRWRSSPPPFAVEPAADAGTMFEVDEGVGPVAPLWLPWA